MTNSNKRFKDESNRLQGWNYAGNGIYFITIVVQNRKCILGEIKNNQMILSDFGNIVNSEWHISFEMRNELSLHEFILMPNHLHALIELKSETETNIWGSPVKQPVFERKPKSVSSFVAGFKSVITTKVDDYIDENKLKIPKYNRNNRFFQTNYHDHIVRNEEEYWRIKNYIKNNPVKWEEDKFREK